MSALDFVTIKYPIPNINHDDEHYQTKDMKLWGEYLVDESGQLHRREYPGEYQPDSYTGEFVIVGSNSGDVTLRFNNGKLQSWVFLGRLGIYVLTYHERNYEDPDDYGVLSTHTSLESAKAEISVNEWIEDDTSAHEWHNQHGATSWTITPTPLIESGFASDNPSSEG